MTAETDNPARRIGCILLAAGGSRRLGQPKQLPMYERKTLLRRAAETVCLSRYRPAVAVLGSWAGDARAEIEDLPIHAVINENWEQGLSSSISAGLNFLTRIDPGLLAVLITLCDQPLITELDLDSFAEKSFRSGAAIVAAEYENAVGVPALFSAALFPDLLTLKGDKGARGLIRDKHGSVLTIPLPAANIDIDNPSDLDRLIRPQ